MTSKAKSKLGVVADRECPLRDARVFRTSSRPSLPASKWHTAADTQYLLELMTPLNRRKVARAMKSGRRTVGTIYRRTRPDENGTKRQRAEVRFDDIAGCLRTPAGGSSRQTILVVEGKTVRSRLLSPEKPRG